MHKRNKKPRKQGETQKKKISTENLNVETKEDIVERWNLNDSKYPHLASFERKYFAVPSSSVYPERLLFKAENFYEQNRNRLFSKTGEKLLFHYRNLKKTRIVFCSITETSFAIVVRFKFLTVA